MYYIVFVTKLKYAGQGGRKKKAQGARRAGEAEAEGERGSGAEETKRRRKKEGEREGEGKESAGRAETRARSAQRAGAKAAHGKGEETPGAGKKTR